MRPVALSPKKNERGTRRTWCARAYPKLGLTRQRQLRTLQPRSQCLGSPRHRASRLGLLEKDRGLPSVLMNIYVFMYILLGEGGGVCNIYSNLCRGARYAPLL